MRGRGAATSLCFKTLEQQAVSGAVRPRTGREIVAKICIKHRQVTDLNVTDLGSSGPRTPFRATGDLWGRSTPFFSITFLSI